MGDAHVIGVIGAGLMGHGIALVMARAGHQVRVHDPVAQAREALGTRIAESLRLLGVEGEAADQVLGRVSVEETIAGAVAEAAFVFEVAPERLDLKRAIFAEMEAAAPAGCVLASNTSVIPITRITEGLRDP